MILGLTLRLSLLKLTIGEDGSRVTRFDSIRKEEVRRMPGEKVMREGSDGAGTLRAWMIV